MALIYVFHVSVDCKGKVVLLLKPYTPSPTRNIVQKSGYASFVIEPVLLICIFSTYIPALKRDSTVCKNRANCFVVTSLLLSDATK